MTYLHRIHREGREIMSHTRPRGGRPCKYCGHVAFRLSDEDCPSRPWHVKVLQAIWWGWKA